MAFKRIRVYDGTDWLQVGSQVPGITDAVGSGSVTLDPGGSGTTTPSYGTVFNTSPFVFVQITGVNQATVAVTPDTVGFTAEFKGEPNDEITFSWFAVLADLGE